MGAVTVVLIHRDQPERCIRTARAFRTQGVPVEVVIVDNGSRPESLERLRAGLPEVDIVLTGRNLGFGPGANVGLRKWLASGAGDLAVVAPHDALPEPSCLQRIVEEVERRPRVGLASAEYGEANRPFIDRNFGGIVVPAERGEGWEPADYPHGTLLVARRACLEEVGLFDERYFAYCEEADLGMRARRAGWEVGIVWDAIVVNPNMSNRPHVTDYLMLRNSLVLVRTHFGAHRAAVQFITALTALIWRTLRPNVERPPLFCPPARWRALADFLRGRVGPPPPELVLAASSAPQA